MQSSIFDASNTCVNDLNIKYGRRVVLLYFRAKTLWKVFELFREFHFVWGVQKWWEEQRGACAHMWQRKQEDSYLYKDTTCGLLQLKETLQGFTITLNKGPLRQFNPGLIDPHPFTVKSIMCPLSNWMCKYFKGGHYVGVECPMYIFSKENSQSSLRKMFPCTSFPRIMLEFFTQRVSLMLCITRFLGNALKSYNALPSRHSHFCLLIIIYL